jgi:hypothetical protein
MISPLVGFPLWFQKDWQLLRYRKVSLPNVIRKQKMAIRHRNSPLWERTQEWSRSPPVGAGEPGEKISKQLTARSDRKIYH